jgi:hypothetical protein
MPQVHSPTSLGLQPIAHHPEVHETCGKDVNILIDQATGEEVILIFIYYSYMLNFIFQVGGAQFKPPGCNNRTHGHMRDHHDLACKSKAVRRGSTIEAFGYDDMYSCGSRQPQGGRKGDTYTEYPHLRADSIQNIRRLFHYAHVSVLIFPLSSITNNMLIF